MSQTTKRELVTNRKARFNYEILETYEAGIVLQGCEVKSLRDGGGSLQEAYVTIVRDELWLIGAHIAPWRYGNIHNHEERRERKLLLHKKEIAKLKKATSEKGYTLIPLAAYLKSGKVKIAVATARGKTNIDKRATIKERDEKRQIDRAMKNS